MKINRRWLIVLAALSLLQLSAYPAATAQISGAHCAKAGTTKIVAPKKYLCTKVGTKLTWHEVLTPKKSTPTLKPSTPSLSPIPTSTPTSSSGPRQGDDYPPDRPAPNRSCPTNGSTAELYGGALTCTNGIWVLNPGQVIGKPTASPNAISTPVPTRATYSTDNSRPSIVTALAADADIQSILSKAPTPKSTFNLLSSPKVEPKLVQSAKQTLPTAVKFWQSVYSPTTPVAILYSYWSEKDWMVAADTAAGDTVNGYQGMASWFDSKPQSAWSGELGSGMHEGMAVNGVTPKIDIVVSGPDAANRPGGTTTAPHEYTHNVQAELAPAHFNVSPCWFIEGMAQYYGMALAYSDPTTFLAARRALMLDREFGAYPFDSQRMLSEWQAAMVENEKTPCGENGGYWIGTLAVEDLVSLKGTTGIISLIKEIERTGNFNQAFATIYGTTIPNFYQSAAINIHDTVADLLKIPYSSTPVAEELIIQKVQDAITAAKLVPTSPLIKVIIEPGALNQSEQDWITNAVQFINYLSPPVTGGDWTLVFPTTMDWFLQHWDMSKEQQHYKDMFANNTAEQLVASVHSYGASNGGWAASFFVSQKLPWFNSDWQMRFMAQLLKPISYSTGANGIAYPEWFSRTFAYPIGAAYSQITSDGNYSQLHKGWISLLNTLPKPIAMSAYEDHLVSTGAEALKAPGALADEILLSKVSLETSANFLVDIYKSNTSWEQQLLTTFGITKAELYSQVMALAP
ncbi:MAG: hypothetical protein WCP64_04025 [Actinomycetes bacterium]